MGITTELNQNLQQANEAWNMTCGYNIQDNRRYIRKLVVLIRKVGCKIGRFVFYPILDKQTSYNAAVTRVVNEYCREINTLQEQVVNMNARIEALQKENFLLNIWIKRIEEDQAADRIMNKQSTECTFSMTYKSYEDSMRGMREEIKQNLHAYDAVVDKVRRNNGDKLFALDLGCGRGEWLELMKDYGIMAIGVDNNESMLDECKQRGLDVVNMDLLLYLKNVASNSVDIITAFQVVEHLPMSVLHNTLEEIARVLRPGGVVILETPNPENMIVGACNFYFDPTHITKLPPELLRILVTGVGLLDAEIMRLHLYNAIDLSDGNEEGANNAIVQMANFFNHFQDYAVYAYKK